jgi:hypothetical protein
LKDNKKVIFEEGIILGKENTIREIVRAKSPLIFWVKLSENWNVVC